MHGWRRLLHYCSSVPHHHLTREINLTRVSPIPQTSHLYSCIVVITHYPCCRFATVQRHAFDETVS
jgi:hypothetical protein